ncbi:MAG: hypothetical protein IK130_06490 [Oscillospiraceae bacterium]|nr:hypothetical protein [Oscillospiraceae bacterium]
MKKVWIGIAIGAFCAAALIQIQLSYTRPQREVRAYYEENKTQLEQLVSECKAQHVSGKVSTENASEPIRTILNGLHKTITVDYDKDGDMRLSLVAFVEKIKGDGNNQPDLYCVNLIYLDEGYDADTRFTKQEPFAGNWYTWSYDTYSG